MTPRRLLGVLLVLGLLDIVLTAACPPPMCIEVGPWGLVVRSHETLVAISVVVKLSFALATYLGYSWGLRHVFADQLEADLFCAAIISMWSAPVIWNLGLMLLH